MKFSTTKTEKFIKSIYWLIFVLVGGFYLFNYFISIDPLLEGKKMLLFTLVVGGICVFWYLRARYFAYDSNGEVLIFVNKGIILRELTNYREHKAEFPKAKLYKFKIKNYVIYRTLDIYVKSKNNAIKKIRFDITFVSPKRVDMLNQSLNKVVRNNKSAE